MLDPPFLCECAQILKQKSWVQFDYNNLDTAYV